MTERERRKFLAASLAAPLTTTALGADVVTAHPVEPATKRAPATGAPSRAEATTPAPRGPVAEPASSVIRTPVAPLTPAIPTTPPGPVIAPDSARLRRLLGDWQVARARSPAAATAVIARFRDELAAAGGTPLVEPADDAPIDGHYQRGRRFRLTFLWDDSTAPVDLVALNTGIGNLNWADSELRPLGETGLRQLSVVVPESTQLRYTLVAGPAVDLANPDRKQLFQWVDTYEIDDPLNTRRWPAIDVPAAKVRFDNLPASRRHGINSRVDLPGAIPPDTIPDVAAQGQWSRHRLHSDVYGNERDVFLYRPAGIAPPSGTEPWRLLVVLDGEEWTTQYAVSQALDALTVAGRIPPTAAVLVSNVDRGRELPPNEDYPRLIADEVLTFARTELPGLSVRADDTVVTGFSYGGLAAAWLGFRRPDAIGRVLAASGSFWWTPEAPGDPPHPFAAANAGHHPGDDWLTRQFVVAERKPLRVYLSAGRLEFGEHGNPGILDNQRRLRDVLQARGYEVRDREGLGGHDAVDWGRAIYHGLPWLQGRPD